MSEVLARIRVRETAGIRRFLYPLTAIINWSPKLKYGESKTFYEMYAGIGLETTLGSAIPQQIVSVSGTADSRVDFAVMLAPGEAQDIIVKHRGLIASSLDPLQLSPTLDGGIRNVQERFAITLGPDGSIEEVTYDGLTHTRGKAEILRNGETAWLSSSAGTADNYLSLAAEIRARSKYKDSCFAQTCTALTSCKSWTGMIHRLEQPKPHDEIVFTLPLTIASPILTCDFGVGGYVFGKLDEKTTEIIWRTEFGAAPHARWSVATAGRTDYIGEVDTAEAFLPQRWFHLIDSDKAVAVAITKVPQDCRAMTVRMTHEGEVTIAFRLGETITGPAEFGVCYHFLNDVPAIAAATNPQSILLPPVVEVLPV